MLFTPLFLFSPKVKVIIKNHVFYCVVFCQNHFLNNDDALLLVPASR